MSSLYRRRELAALSHSAVLTKAICTIVLLLLAHRSSATSTAESKQQPTEPSWEDAMHLLYEEVEGGIHSFLTRMHLTHPLKESTYLGSSNATLEEPAEAAEAAEVQSAERPEQHNLPQAAFGNSRAIHFRRLHENWLGALQTGRHARRLAQAPVGADQIFASTENCKSVTCNNQCCDAFFTYGSSGNNTCTQPSNTCSPVGGCQYTSNNSSSGGCSGLNYGVHSFPSDTPADNPTNQVGYACPSGADSQCSYLNTFASDMSACTSGACIPTTAGGLSCVPLIKGIGNYGCAAAIQTFTGQVQMSSNTNAALSSVRTSTDIGNLTTGG